MNIADASAQLNLKNPAYKKAVELYVWQAYLLDIDKGDVTTDLFVSKKNQIVKAEIIAKESGILAGVMEAEWFLNKLGIRILKSKKDGSVLRTGEQIMFLSGRAKSILAGERTLLNLLQRMSGIATATHQMAAKIPKSIKLLATRKTFWGELDKRAVSVGGGYTHRLNLADAVLVKDNHIALSDNFEKVLLEPFAKTLQQKRVLDITKKVRFIEIELDSLDSVKKFVKMVLLEPFAKTLQQLIKSKNKIIVMLDNFNPSDIKKAIVILRKTGVLIEASGGINEKNIRRYAIEGLNFISSGAITNKAKALDLSLNIQDLVLNP